MWSSGDVVALREIWGGRVWKARAWVVVEDTPERLVLWIPKGAQTMVPDGLPAVPVGNWRLREGSFGLSALRLTRPGASHSILHFFRAPGRFNAWYVNLERPLMRSSVGFDLIDLFLDISVTRDGRWRWLDEHELDEAVRAGLIAPDEAGAARAEGQRVLEEWPFPTGWEDWRPTPGWKRPLLPDGWAVVG
jgi:Protein of unknown function (DUF402)